MPDSENPVRTHNAEQGSAATDEGGQAEAAAREAQGIYLALINAIDQGFCTIEVKFDDEQRPVDYRFLEVSPSFERQTGIQNAAGRWMRDIAADQDQFWFDIYGRVALTGEPERFENFSTPLDRWWAVYAFKVEGRGRIAVLFDDISDRKRAEAGLRASEERFRGFVTASADVVYRMSPDWSQMRQLDGQGFVGDMPEPSEDWMDRYILPDDRGVVQEAIDQAIRTKSQFDLEHRVIRADGTPGWTSSRATPMLGEYGEITEWLGTASDITQTRSEREALRQSDERYRILFEAIDSGFCILEMIFDEGGSATDYRFVETNPAFERQSGLIDAVGRRIREFAPDLEEHWFERYGRVALTGESMRVEGEVAPLGRWFDINAFRVGAPEQHRVAVLFTDITARRNAEIALRESEEQFETLLSQAPLGVYLVDGNLVIRQVNPVALPVFGTIAGGPIGRDFEEVIHILWDKDYADEVVGIFRHTLETGEPYIAPERAEYRVDRDIIEYYEWRVDRIALSGGQYGVVCYFRDISAQVESRHEIEKARELARESEERQAFLLRLSDALRPLGDPLEVQSAALRVLGEHLAVNRAFFNEVDEVRDAYVIHRTYVNGVAPRTGQFRLSEIPRTTELAASGQIVVYDDVGADPRLSQAERASFAAMEMAAGVGVPLIKDGRWVAGLGVHNATPRQWTPDEIDLIRDTAERTWAAVERARAEVALHVAEARYRTLFDTIDSGFCVVEVDLNAAGGRVDYRVIEANPAFFRQTGFPEDISGQWLRQAAPHLEEHWYESYGRVARTGVSERFEEGSTSLGRWFDVYAFRADGTEECRVAILFTDISARRTAEHDLRQLNETLEVQVADRTAELDRTWRLSSDLLVVIATDGTFAAVNQAWTALLGWSSDELVDMTFMEITHPDDLQRTIAVFHGIADVPLIDPYEVRLRHKDGSFRWIAWTAAFEAGRVFANGRDVTEERARQAELISAHEALRQSQKMEAMGQLTGGVAHDFNNLLTPIVGSLDLLQRQALGGPREQRLIDGAIQSAEKAKTLVQRLLAFARRQPLRPEPVDVAALVIGMGDLVASTTGPQIKVMVEAEPDLPRASADPNQLEMAILNLSVNARDAMPDGGTLRISAAAERVEAGHRSKLPAGSYVRLSVADAGLGMDAETLARATEPFYSTKGIGRGTGLGLSMVHGLAAQLGGALTISSQRGLGTNVELWLPVSNEPMVQPPAGETALAGRLSGQALLVDDEELVRASTSAMLSDLGYEVAEAESAEHALRLVEQGLVPDLLVTDHLMPGMNGTELAYALRTRRPDLPVLIVSGYAEVEGLAPDLPRLAKPFRHSDLAASLAALIG